MASLGWSLLMLALVGALVPVALWALRRLQQLPRRGQAARRLQVVDQLALGPRERLVTVRVDDRLLVLGVTPHAITPVTTLASRPVTAPAEPPAREALP